MVVTNYLIGALGSKQNCEALFVDLSKAFDSADHELLQNKLRNVGWGPKTVNRFRNDFVLQTQCVCIFMAF